MTRRDPETRRLLAAEYVLGTLRGRARRRFERMRNDDAAFCQDADDWERRFGPMIEALPGVEPPARVWQEIERRIKPAAARPGRRLGFWRGLALAAGAAAAVLLLVVLWPSPADVPAGASNIAVLTDAESRPAWLLRFDVAARTALAEPLGGPRAGEGKAFELWLLPSGNRPPLSLGTLADAGRQAIDLSDTVAGLVSDAAGVLVSLEPDGGSPTGRPTGPILYQGRIAATQP